MEQAFVFLFLVHYNGGEVKQQTPGSSITRRGNKCILVLVKVVTLKWLWRPLPAGLARAQLHGGQFKVVPSQLRPHWIGLPSSSTPLLRCEFVEISNLTLKVEDFRLGAFLLHRARVRGAMLFQRTRSMQSFGDGMLHPAIKTRPARG